MSYIDVETASIRAGNLAAHAALIALAGEALTAGGDEANGRKFQAGAEALEAQLDALADDLIRISEAWRLERGGER